MTSASVSAITKLANEAKSAATKQFKSTSSLYVSKNSKEGTNAMKAFNKPVSPVKVDKEYENSIESFNRAKTNYAKAALLPTNQQINNNKKFHK